MFIYLRFSIPLRLVLYWPQACHPDLVLKSKTNPHFSADMVEATVCRLCNYIAEDATESKCHHIFDRECIKQNCEAAAGRDLTA